MEKVMRLPQTARRNPMEKMRARARARVRARKP
jgi:hypothetical protein